MRRIGDRQHLEISSDHYVRGGDTRNQCLGPGRSMYDHLTSGDQSAIERPAEIDSRDTFDLEYRCRRSSKSYDADRRSAEAEHANPLRDAGVRQIVGKICDAHQPGPRTSLVRRLVETNLRILASLSALNNYGAFARRRFWSTV